MTGISKPNRVVLFVLRHDNEWWLRVLLDFPEFQERPPSNLEAQVVLEALNTNKKALPS